MNEAIRTHREAALDSPYSRDRRDAVEELGRAFGTADAEDKREILETLRQVALEATSAVERELARETLVDCFEDDPTAATDVVVRAFRELARDGKFTDDQLSAIDTLRRVAREVPDEDAVRIRETLADLADGATSEDVRTRARRRLTDLDGEAGGGTGGSADADYLVTSLAEHVEAAAGESPEACRKRVAELRDYVVDHRVDDEAYDQVRADLDALVDQLDVVPTGDELDDERRERVERLAERAKRLYLRNE